MKMIGLFSGIGMLEHAAHQLGYETAACVENDSFCQKVLRKRFPDAKIFGDIREVSGVMLKEAAGGHVSLIAGGFPCFVANTMVYTDRGYLPIQDIEVGDLVLTHKRRWRTVTSTMNRHADETVVIIGQGIPRLVTTKEHPFYVRQRGQSVWDNPARKYHRILLDEEWVEAEKLTSRPYYSGLPVPPPSDRVVEHDLLWLVGRWLADGHWGNGALFFSIGRAKTDEFERQLDLAGVSFNRQEMRTAVRYRVTHDGVKSLVADGCEHLAQGKNIPAWAHQLKTDSAISLLMGYVSGDGSWKDGYWRCTTVSKRLALGLAMLHQRAFSMTASVFRIEVPETTVIEGRVVNQRTQFQVSGYMHNRSSIVEDDWAWRLIRKTEIGGPALVYNISVDEDESYIADGATVHNCQDLSSAGKGKGLDGARSGLWFEFLRVIDECRPGAVLIENVAVLRSRGLDVVISGLASIGYGCWYDCHPALSVGAPHLRDRVWITAVPFWKMPPLGGQIIKNPSKMPRAGASTILGTIEREPQATVKACKAAMGAVRREDGVTWLTKTDSPLFPTPSASSYGTNQGGAAGRVGVVRHSLESMARNRMWPSDEERGGRGDLIQVVRGNKNDSSHGGQGVLLTPCLPEGQRLWPTATSHPRTHTPRPVHHGMQLANEVDKEEQRVWPTPSAATASQGPGRSGRDGGPNLRTSVSENGKGPLSPDFVEWLLGIPIGHTDLSCDDPIQLDWLSEYDIPRVKRDVPDRKQRLMACGNSLVWAVAYHRIAELLSYGEDQE